MLAQVGDDRSNLIALARLYCEQCDSQILATESNDAFLLSSCVSDILSNTRYKLKESVKLLKSLRRSFILDEDKCQALLLRLTKHMCEHGTADDRSVQRPHISYARCYTYEGMIFIRVYVCGACVYFASGLTFQGFPFLYRFKKQSVVLTDTFAGSGWSSVVSGRRERGLGCACTRPRLWWTRGARQI